MTEEQANKIIDLLESLNGNVLMIHEHISTIDSNVNMNDFHLSSIDTSVNDIKDALKK